MTNHQLPLFMLLLLALASALLAAACGGDSTEPEPTLILEPSPLASPMLSITPPQPTPSPPRGTPLAIDTSTWLTYTSPYHAFSIKYPPDWTLDAPRFESQAVYVRNPQFVVANEQRRVAGIKAHFTPQPGEAWFQVVAGSGLFSVEAMSTGCSGSVTATTLKEFRAALCSTGTMWVERPDGGILQIVIENVGQDLDVAQIIETIRSMLTFDQE